MIQREWQTVAVLSYTNTIDSYGQKRQTTPTSRNVQMVVKPYQWTNVDNPKFVDVKFLGLTTDKTITNANVIQIGTNNYNILHCADVGKYLEVFLCQA